jgi:disulfide bond formation protein DsbB
MLQRVAYLAIALIGLVAAIHNPGRLFHIIYSGLITLAALVGGGIASRQVWLQHLPPDQVPECGPGIEYMLGAFPFGEALKMILMGSGECAEVLWRFLGLSIPEWSLVCFIGLLTMGIVMLFKKIEHI